MSHTRVKTTYEQQGEWASTEERELYCHHNHSTDITSFYEDDGSVANMIFQEWGNNDKWDAVVLLWSPFKQGWSGELKDGVRRWNGEFKDKTQCQ